MRPSFSKLKCSWIFLLEQDLLNNSPLPNLSAAQAWQSSHEISLTPKLRLCILMNLLNICSDQLILHPIRVFLCVFLSNDINYSIG